MGAMDLDSSGATVAHPDFDFTDADAQMLRQFNQEELPHFDPSDIEDFKFDFGSGDDYAQGADLPNDHASFDITEDVAASNETNGKIHPKRSDFSGEDGLMEESGQEREACPVSAGNVTGAGVLDLLNLNHVTERENANRSDGNEMEFEQNNAAVDIDPTNDNLGTGLFGGDTTTSSTVINAVDNQVYANGHKQPTEEQTQPPSDSLRPDLADDAPNESAKQHAVPFDPDAEPEKAEEGQEGEEAQEAEEQVTDQSRSPSPAASDGERHSLPTLAGGERRALRANARNGQVPAYASWIDHDDTGDYDPDTENGLLRRRRLVSCAACRRAKKHCPLKSTDKPPCSSCKKAGIRCTFEPLREKKRKPQTSEIVIRKGTLSPIQGADASSSRAIAGSSEVPSTLPSGEVTNTSSSKPIVQSTESPSATSRAQVDDTSSSKPTVGSAEAPSTLPAQKQRLEGTIIQLKTRLSHPITFNATYDQPCDWCSGNNPFYPLFGHIDPTTRKGGVRAVKALLWANKQGCGELENGYVELGKGASRMCVYCTLNRVRIMFCKEHHFRPARWLGEPGNEALAEEALNRQKKSLTQQGLRRLKEVAEARKRADPKGGGAMMRAEMDKWCVICPSLATKECCAGDKMECPLRLCTVCYKLVAGRNTNDGDFLKFVTEIGEKIEKHSQVKDAYPHGLRADYDFFDWKGFMMRQVRAAQRELDKRRQEQLMKQKNEQAKKLRQSSKQKQKSKGRGKEVEAEVNENGKRPLAQSD